MCDQYREGMDGGVHSVWIGFYMKGMLLVDQELAGQGGAGSPCSARCLRCPKMYRGRRGHADED